MPAIRLMLTLFILLFININAHADKYVLSHLCFKPEKPLFMASFFQHELYKKDIGNYKLCIRRFINSQERAIVAHQDAIKEASEELEQFQVQK